jgi:hypothetical protein
MIGYKTKGQLFPFDATRAARRAAVIGDTNLGL